MHCMSFNVVKWQLYNVTVKGHRIIYLKDNLIYNNVQATKYKSTIVLISYIYIYYGNQYVIVRKGLISDHHIQTLITVMCVSVNILIIGCMLRSIYRVLISPLVVVVNVTDE